MPLFKELGDQQKAVYYSSWLYTGVRNLTALPHHRQAETIAQHLGMELGLIHRVLRFLIQNGLCLENESGLTYGPASTHVQNDSPFVNKHHQNWRFQSIQAMEKRREEDLFFTSPMSLSEKAFEEIRSQLPHYIQSIFKVTSPSPSETVACLNIDWFKY